MSLSYPFEFYSILLSHRVWSDFQFDILALDGGVLESFYVIVGVYLTEVSVILYPICTRLCWSSLVESVATSM